ncbi:hypothetical protein [Ideonella sp.]|uniref:hypothetical protein n=1 Tax=Ideonella sp. TaxID=1929293 RepID=UPI003BB48E9B
MAVPAPNHPCWQRLASGGMSKIKTQHLGTQLLAKRIERSTDPMSAKISDIQAFFTKWERVLSAEVQQLSSI